MLFIYPLPFQSLLLFHALFLLILMLIFKFPWLSIDFKFGNGKTDCDVDQ